MSRTSSPSPRQHDEQELETPLKRHEPLATITDVHSTTQPRCQVGHVEFSRRQTI